MGIKKTKLLACESVYWVNINTDKEKHIKSCNTCLKFQQKQPKEKIIHHGILLRPWEELGVDKIHLNNKNYLCIIDYYSKFPVIKGMDGLSAESLITRVKVIFVEYSIPCSLMSDTGTNFCFREIQKFLQKHQHWASRVLIVSPPKQWTSQTCIKFIKCTIKMLRLQWWHSHGIITNPKYTTRARSTKSSNIAV